MPDYQAIYQNQAAQYELMVSREDYQGNLLPALNAIRPLAGLDVVELGAGTGRLTRQMRRWRVRCWRSTCRSTC